MDLKNLSHEELIEYCKSKKLNYLTKAKKPMAKITLLRILLSHSFINNDKKKDLEEKIIEEEIIEFKDDVNMIEFGKLFELINSNLKNNMIIEDNVGIPLITCENKIKNIKLTSNVRLTIGNNIFIATNSGGNKVPIKYYEGNCYYNNTLSLCKLKSIYQSKIKIKYIYYYLLKKKKYIEETYQKGLVNKALDTYIFNFMNIPIPSLEKQEDIIKDYEDIEIIIKSKKTLIKNLRYEKELYIKYINNEFNKKFKLISLIELCSFQPRSIRQSSYGEKEGLYPFFKNPKNIDSYVYSPDYNCESLIIVDNEIPNIYYSFNFSACDNCFILQNKDSSIVLLKYIYIYLVNNLNLIDMNNLQEIKIPIPNIKKQNELIIELEEYNKNQENSIKIIENLLKDSKNIKEFLFKF